MAATELSMKAQKAAELKSLKDKFAIHAMRGLLSARTTTSRVTEGEIILLIEDSWKLAAAMVKGRP